MNLYKLELQKFIKEHRDWEDILSQPPYALKISRDNGYIMFKYNQLDADFTIPLVREARGIIFRESDLECVCFPFMKFGNWGEMYCPDIDWTTASVQEKVDGSLIKIWFDNGWHVSTNGTIDAKNAILNDETYSNFMELFLDAMPLSHDDWDVIAARNYTYMFELVSPHNRVVIPYEDTELYFLGMRDNDTGKEIMPEKSEFSNYFTIPKRFPLTNVDEVVEAASKMDWKHEGFVVCDGNFNRVKIKSPEYIMAHYARTNGNISIEKLIKIILDGEQAEFLTYADDYAQKLSEIEAKMHKIAQNMCNEIKVLFGTTNSFETRAEYAKEVIKRPAYMKDFLFHCYDERIFWDYARSCWEIRNWVRALEEFDNIEEKKKEETNND